LVRNFANTEGAQVGAVSDLDPEKLSLARRRHTEILTTTEFRDLLIYSRIDAIAIATAVNSHYELALTTLRAGKHVFLEKPLAQTSEQACHLEATEKIKVYDKGITVKSADEDAHQFRIGCW
jgi:predicted dehydrogenase